MIQTETGLAYPIRIQSRSPERHGAISDRNLADRRRVNARFWERRKHTIAMSEWITKTMVLTVLNYNLVKDGDYQLL